MQAIPTIDDWGNHNQNYDVQYAFKIFYGKSNADVQKEFYRSVIERCDELRFMPEVPFRYYVLGFRDYVLNGNFPLLGGADAASCFLKLIEEKLTDSPLTIKPVIESLLPAIDYCAENQEKFDAAESIYGRFSDAVTRIKALINVKCGVVA